MAAAALSGSATVPVCPACLAATARAARPCANREYQLQICSQCGLQYSIPMRAADADWYEGSEIYLNRERWIASRYSHRVIEPRWEFTRALYRIAGEPRRVLDVGCGPGEFLFFAERAGHVGTGIDFNPAALAAAKEVFGLTRLYRCSVSELFEQHGQGRFDVVTMFEVMEHIDNPFETLCMLREAARPGGYVCVSVPGLRRFPAAFDAQIDVPPTTLRYGPRRRWRAFSSAPGFRMSASIGSRSFPAISGSM